MLRIFDLSEQHWVDAHGNVLVAKHAWVVEEARVERPDCVIVGARVRVCLRQGQCLLIVEAFLDELRLGLGRVDVTRGHKHLIVSAGHVVVGERVVKLRVVDKVDPTDSIAELVGVLPVGLLLQDVRIGVL